MAHDLPPLGALRVFEAAARLLSFTKAAQEVGTTQSAASYQIKRLEERLGTPLFARKTRRVELTEAGALLSPQVTAALSTLSDAWLSTKGAATGSLSIAADETFAQNWLAMRLGAFQALRPELDVKVQNRSNAIDFSRDAVDMAVWLGNGHWPALRTHRLFPADFTPMISPELAHKVGGINRPEDLYKVPLCCADYRWWKMWFDAAGTPFEPDRLIRGPSLETQTNDALAAITQQGAAILTKNLYRTFVATGQLIQPFDITASDGDDYWLVYSEGRRNVTKIRIFRDWILEEASQAGD